MTVQEMVKLYEEGKSAYEILALTDYKSVNSIYNRIRKYTTMRSKAGFVNPNIVHNYFETIDTEAKAYFLGFIMADGCVSIRKDSQNCLSIEIRDYDKYILEKFKEEIKTDNIIENTRKDCVRLRIHSNKIFEDLAKFNIVPDKCHKHNSCVILDEPYMKHFIRGLFDGDGWVYNRKNNKLSFGICGTYESMDSIKKYLIKTLNLSNVKTGKYYGKVPFFLFSNQKDIKKIYDYLYEDATIFLTRKKEKFDRINTEVNK